MFEYKRQDVNLNSRDLCLRASGNLSEKELEELLFEALDASVAKWQLLTAQRSEASCEAGTTTSEGDVLPVARLRVGGREFYLTVVRRR